MKRNFLRSFISILLSAVIICGIMSGCGNNDPDRPALTVWVYANEYKQKIEQSFCSDMSSLSWDVNIVTVPVDELDARLSAAQQDGCLPDNTDGVEALRNRCNEQVTLSDAAVQAAHRSAPYPLPSTSSTGSTSSRRSAASMSCSCARLCAYAD